MSYHAYRRRGKIKEKFLKTHILVFLYIFVNNILLENISKTHLWQVTKIRDTNDMSETNVLLRHLECNTAWRECFYSPKKKRRKRNYILHFFNESIALYNCKHRWCYMIIQCRTLYYKHFHYIHETCVPAFLRFSDMRYI